MASYPGNVPSFTILVDDQDDILAEHQNTPNGEITSIATFVGPIGSGLNQSYSTDVLGFLLGAAQTTFQIAFLNVTTIRVSAGVALVTNSGGSQRVMRSNGSTTDIDGSFLDASGPTFAVSTRYYVYCDADAASNASDFIISTNSSAPSGVTRYLKIGRFDTDSGGNVVEESVCSTAVLDAAPKGSVVKSVSYITGEMATGTGTIVDDDSIPQNTEGDQYMSLSYTPVNATNKLRITVVFNWSTSSGGSCGIGLFQDSTANALRTGKGRVDAAGEIQCNTFEHSMVAAVVVATVFKVRAAVSAGTLTFNGSGGSRRYGGTLSSAIIVEEIRA